MFEYDPDMQHRVLVRMDSGSKPAPGLLLEWEKRNGEWWGHVWVLVQSNAHEPYDRVHESWIPAERLIPERI